MLLLFSQKPPEWDVTDSSDEVQKKIRNQLVVSVSSGEDCLQKLKDALESAYNLADIAYDKRTGERKGYLQCILDCIQTYPYQYPQQFANEPELLILYQITLGNVYLQLNHFYLDYYVHDSEDKWNRLALDAFWRANMLTETALNQPSSLNAESYNNIMFYKWLIHLNIGKCHCNYAVQHRRSDYEPAKAIFEEIIGAFVCDGAANFLHQKNEDEKLPEHRLISISETNFNDLFQQGSNIETVREKIRIILSEALLLIAQIKRLNYENPISACRAYYSFCKNENLINDNNSEESPNYKVRFHIESGLFYRKEGRFTEAVTSFLAAEKLEPNGSHNLDVINNLSSIYRKILEGEWVSNQCEKAKESIRKWINTTNFGMVDGEGNIIGCLRSKAQIGNLYALREFIHWAGLYLEKQNPAVYEMLKCDFQSDTASSQLQQVLNYLGNTLNDILGRTLSPQNKETFTISKIDRQLKELIQEYPIGDNPNPAEDCKKTMDNFQLQYLRCVFFSRLGLYNRIHEDLEELCRKEELKYIRRGTLGLKVRFMLATSLARKGEFEEALKILEEIRTYLKKEADTEKNPANIDFRTELLTGQCLMHLGRYGEARHEIYEKHLDKIQEKQGYHNNARIIRFLLDAALCDIHLDGEIGQMLQAEIDEINDRTDWETAVDLEMLQGYSDYRNKKYVEASRHFDLAYQRYRRNSPFRMSPLEAEYQDLKYGSNRPAQMKGAECASAYIISLKELAEKGCEAEKAHAAAAMKNFLLGIPNSCVLSLQAMICLAKWLNKFICGTPDSSKPLFSAFLRCDLYPERGTTAFQNLKNNRAFQYYNAQMQGEILALLLEMYEPIKNLRESHYVFVNKSEKESDTLDFTTFNPDKEHIVQYTTLNTLKALLKSADNEEKAPKLHVNNCGYMNDVFEGKLLMDYLYEETNVKSFLSFDIATSESEIMPTAKNVYIASFTKETAPFSRFEMWSIYGSDETGCWIGFEPTFFDIREEAQVDEKLKPFFVSRYTDEDYPLYWMKYTNSLKDSDKETVFHLKEAIIKIIKWYEGKETNNIIPGTEGAKKSPQWEAKKAVTDFIADAVNEIRFLYKGEEYHFEREYRIVINSPDGIVDDREDTPRTYVTINRNLQNLNVTLGSKISRGRALRLATWMKQTGKVSSVQQSTLNLT